MLFKTKVPSISYNEEMLKKFINTNHNEVFVERETCTVEWNVELAPDTDGALLMTVAPVYALLEIEYMTYDFLYHDPDRINPPEPHKPTYGTIEINAAKSNKEWKLMNTHISTEIKSNSEGGLMIFKLKPLAVEIDFKAKEIFIDEWGDKPSKRDLVIEKVFKPNQNE